MSDEKIRMLEEVVGRLYDAKKAAARNVTQARREYKAADYRWRLKCSQLARWKAEKEVAK
jgi:hypothetical protein